MKVWSTNEHGQVKSDMYFIRKSQVEFNDPIEKSRGGIYKDTPENRKMGRVGQKFGGSDEDESVVVLEAF